MSFSEIIMILAGLIVGWVVVSRIISVFSRRSPDHKGQKWFDVLDVPSDATVDNIDKAFDNKRRGLIEREPLIMTKSEKEKAVQKLTQLDTAYRLGKGQRIKSKKT